MEEVVGFSLDILGERWDSKKNRSLPTMRDDAEISSDD